MAEEEDDDDSEADSMGEGNDLDKENEEDEEQHYRYSDKRMTSIVFCYQNKRYHKITRHSLLSNQNPERKKFAVHPFDPRRSS